MGRTVRVFHISDLHGRSEDGPQGERARREAPFRWRVIGDKWDANLRALRADGRPVDLVVFTGDLGDWGHETDYPMGVAFLKRTCAALEVPLERLFVVPGNHDIAQKTEVAAWKGLRAGLAHAGRAGSDWIAGGNPPPGFEAGWREAIRERQAAFWKAVTIDLDRGVLGPWRHPHGRLGYRARVDLDGLATPVWVVGLDTSWLAGDRADAGSLLLTEHQIGLLTSQGGSGLPGFRLALMHHRFADLADGNVARRLLADRVDLVLHGHQHDAAVEPWASPDHNLLVLAAGCLYEGDEGHRYLNACQMLDLELTNEGRPERAIIRFRGWAERTTGLFWGDDGLLYESATNGRLVLRRHARGWSVDDGAPTPSEGDGKRVAPMSGLRAEILGERAPVEDRRKGMLPWGDAKDATGQPLAPGATLPAAAVFVRILDLGEMDGPRCQAAMAALHLALRSSLMTRGGGVAGVRVLSTASGAIVVVPDLCHCDVVGLFGEMATAITAATLAIRVGLAHGTVEFLTDADGMLNAVGGCLNIAARIAYASTKPEFVVHESYADVAAAIVAADHWLARRQRQAHACQVKGKRGESFACFAAPAGTIALLEVSTVVASANTPFTNSLLLAYDLPNFSDGDERELASRFRSVVQEVVRLRSVGVIPATVRMSFSPGGDGAIMALTGVHTGAALMIAERLTDSLAIESQQKAATTNADVRIALHYGPVQTYQNAEGAERPTGPTVADADFLAGDDEAKKYRAVILSGTVIGDVASGSRARLAADFMAIAPLSRANGRSIPRFVRRSTPPPTTPPPTTAILAAVALPPTNAPASTKSAALLHVRLSKLSDPLFERIALFASIDRSLLPSKAAPLAERIVALAQMAQADGNLENHLAALLDEHAPWTRQG